MFLVCPRAPMFPGGRFEPVGVVRVNSLIEGRSSDTARAERPSIRVDVLEGFAVTDTGCGDSEQVSLVAS